jgi:hypothetical protein
MDADVAFLVGMSAPAFWRRAAVSSSPRGSSRSAKEIVKALIVGNPANTKSLGPESFAAMTRLGDSRAGQAGATAGKIRCVAVWANSLKRIVDLLHLDCLRTDSS